MNLKIAFEEKCPKCKSDNVEWTGGGNSFSNNYDYLRKLTKLSYQCNNCNWRFKINERNVNKLNSYTWSNCRNLR